MNGKDIEELSRTHSKLQTLIHYVNKETLQMQHKKQKEKKASGVDKITKAMYEENLDSNLDNLLSRMKTFSYRPQPVRRTYIPKIASDKLRPLGIPAYEDKLVQGVMAEVLNGVYEPRFEECSYGFRPKRNCHMAIREINQIIMTKKVNYILDADIKGFFDNVDHKWLVKFLENDIQDKNFIRYVVRFLKAGIMEEMNYYQSEEGTPQGGLISPVLANVYLHYVLDDWFTHFIKKKAKGEVYLVRYADDFVVMFQYEDEAKAFYEVLKRRLAKFNLEIEESKTRIIPFGRFKGTKETFDFLGFTHINSTTRTGKYTVLHRTSKKKLKAKKQAVKEWIEENMHKPIKEIMEKINMKLTGHYAYYGINGNYASLAKYYKYIKYELYKRLNKRHQKRSVTYKIYLRIWHGLQAKQPKIYVNIW